MDWIAWAIIGVIILIACVVCSAAMEGVRYRREIWDEFHHPPDSEVKQDEQH